MKDNFEQSIKDSLQGYEAPYNPGAWDAMRAQLDAKMPVNPSSKTGLAKWFVGAAVIGGIGVGSYFLMNSNGSEAPVTTQNEVTANNEQNGPETNVDETLVTSNPSESVAESNSTQPNERVNNPGQNANVTTHGLINPVDNGPTNNVVNPANTGNNNGNSNNSNNTQTQNTQNSTNRNNVTSSELDLPNLEDVCQNSVISISNTNKVALVLKGPGTYQLIPENESSKIRLKNAGSYILSEYKKENGKTVQFVVKDAPIADFSIDPLTKFESGLPTTKLAANVPGTQFEWIINGERVSGAQTDAHFYRQGTHDVTLVVTGANGCETLQTKSVYIEDNYNLMAPTSFRPYSNDISVNKFIPFALKERNVNFKMTIIDPADGHTLFETNDASMGWDGIDGKTGQMVSFERVYIWKVTLEKAAKFEQRTEYSGQVIPVR